MRFSPRLSLSVVALTIFALVSPTGVWAQGGYFGRNKVQYQDFKFKILKTDHFDVYYYPEEQTSAQLAPAYSLILQARALLAD